MGYDIWGYDYVALKSKMGYIEFLFYNRKWDLMWLHRHNLKRDLLITECCLRSKLKKQT